MTKKKLTFKLKNLNTSKIIVSNTQLANTFFTRLKGLMGTRQLNENSGLLISPCQQVHTHFMQYPLDLVFLDNKFNVLEIVQNIKPWRFSRLIKSAYYVLEVPANSAIEKIEINHQLKLISND